MTAITYSSTAGRPLKEILVLEHPSASGNVLEPLFKIIEPYQTMLDPSKNLSLEVCVVNGQKWIEHGEAKDKEGERKRETCGRWVNSIKRGRTEERCHFRDKCYNKVRKDLKCGRGYVEAWHRSKRDNPGTDGARKQKGNKTEDKLPEGEVRRQRNMRWHHISLWMMLLLFSLGPNTASSQVTVLNV